MDNQGPAPSFEDNLKIINHMPQVFRQIDNPLYYHPDLLQARVDGDVHVRVILGEEGKLRRVCADSWSGPQVLRGWVNQILQEALAGNFFRRPLERAVAVDLNFHFLIVQDASFFRRGPTIESNTLHFYINEVMPAEYDVTTGELIRTVVKKNRGDDPLKVARTWNTGLEFCQ